MYYAREFEADMIGTETPGKPTLEESHSEETFLEFIQNMRPIIEDAEKLDVTTLLKTYGKVLRQDSPLIC